LVTQEGLGSGPREVEVAEHAALAVLGEDHGAAHIGVADDEELLARERVAVRPQGDVAGGQAGAVKVDASRLVGKVGVGAHDLVHGARHLVDLETHVGVEDEGVLDLEAVTQLHAIVVAARATAREGDEGDNPPAVVERRRQEAADVVAVGSAALAIA